MIHGFSTPRGRWGATVAALIAFASTVVVGCGPSPTKSITVYPDATDESRCATQVERWLSTAASGRPIVVGHVTASGPEAFSSEPFDILSGYKFCERVEVVDLQIQEVVVAASDSFFSETWEAYDVDDAGFPTVLVQLGGLVEGDTALFSLTENVPSIELSDGGTVFLEGYGTYIFDDGGCEDEILAAVRQHVVPDRQKTYISNFDNDIAKPARDADTLCP